jgi:hypothetical protein
MRRAFGADAGSPSLRHDRETRRRRLRPVLAPDENSFVGVS